MDLSAGNLIRTSRTYYSCEMRLGRGRDIYEKSKVKTFEKDFIVLKRELRESLHIIDYTHLCCLFLNKMIGNLSFNRIFTLKSFLI